MSESKKESGLEKAWREAVEERNTLAEDQLVMRAFNNGCIVGAVLAAVIMGLVAVLKEVL